MSMATMFRKLFQGRDRARRRITAVLAAAVVITTLTGPSGTINMGAGKPPVSLSAQKFEADYKTQVTHLRGDVKISQGDISVTADEAQGQATSKDSKSYHWVFTGKVHVRAESQGDLRADRGIVEIVNGALASALVTGSPATFEQTRSTSDRLIKGHAATIDYEVAAGAVKLTGDAFLSDQQNDNDMHSPTIIYNVRDRRIEGDVGGDAGGRVRMRITPKTVPRASTGAASSAAGSGPRGKP
jgi:lipopolysaccharide transport protein LptA